MDETMKDRYYSIRTIFLTGAAIVMDCTQFFLAAVKFSPSVLRRHRHYWVSDTVLVP